MNLQDIAPELVKWLQTQHATNGASAAPRVPSGGITTPGMAANANEIGVGGAAEGAAVAPYVPGPFAGMTGGALARGALMALPLVPTAVRGGVAAGNAVRQMGGLPPVDPNTAGGAGGFVLKALMGQNPLPQEQSDSHLPTPEQMGYTSPQAKDDGGWEVTLMEHPEYANDPTLRGMIPPEALKTYTDRLQHQPPTGLSERVDAATPSSATSSIGNQNEPVLSDGLSESPNNYTGSTSPTSKVTTPPPATSDPAWDHVSTLLDQYHKMLEDSKTNPTVAPKFSMDPALQASVTQALQPNDDKHLSFTQRIEKFINPDLFNQNHNKLTEKQSAAVRMGSADMMGANEATRQAALHQYETGGMSPQLLQELGIQAGQLQGATGSIYERAKQNQDLFGKRILQSESPEMEKTTPGYLGRTADIARTSDLLSKYPDLLTPDAIQHLANINGNDTEKMQNTLDLISKSRGFNPMQMMQAELLSTLMQSGRLGNLGTSSNTSTKPNLNLKALQK